MPSEVERVYERTVRIDAPLSAVYEELDSAHRLARFIPQVDAPVEGPDDDSSPCSAHVFIGPLSYEVDGHITVDRVAPLRCLDVTVQVPGLRLSLEGTFDLTRNAVSETTLRYFAAVRSTHPLLRRMPSALIGALEEHVDTTTDLIVVRAHQYTRARRALTETD